MKKCIGTGFSPRTLRLKNNLTLHALLPGVNFGGMGIAPKPSPRGGRATLAQRLGAGRRPNKKIKSRRDGPPGPAFQRRADLPQHPRGIIGDPVSSQQLHKFLLISPLRMMCPLIFDVRNDAIGLRCAHAECAIAFLPRKARSGRSRVIEPLRRTALYRLHCLR